MDPDFDLSKPETFAAVFQLSQEANFTKQVSIYCLAKTSLFYMHWFFEFKVESNGRLIQERLSHQLDLVEVDIAEQVKQKSQNFFQVMTYHDALMTQLKSLVKLIVKLRSNLAEVDDASLKVCCSSKG